VWAVTFALLTCLGIDFSNPLLPGVVRFGDEASVHALRAERARTDERPTRTVPPPSPPVRVVDVDAPVPRALTGGDRLPPQAGPRRARGALDTARAAPTALDDH
jgi:hypothetical protein